MTSRAGRDANEELKRQKEELEEALNAQIEDTMRRAALPNSVAWLAVVLGSFVLNLVILIAITGG